MLLTREHCDNIRGLSRKEQYDYLVNKLGYASHKTAEKAVLKAVHLGWLEPKKRLRTPVSHDYCPGQPPPAKRLTDEDYLAILLEGSRRQEFHSAIHYMPDTVSRTLPCDKPQIIAFTGDWHIGSAATDHRAIAEMVDFVRRRDNIHLVGMGDYAHAMKLSHDYAGVVREQILDPQSQITAARGILRILQPHILAAILSSHSQHDGMVDANTGINPYADLAVDIPLFANRGHVSVTWGEHNLVIYASHKLRGHSQYNVLHAQVKALWDGTTNADVIVGAHTHKGGAIMDYIYSDRRRVLMQSGTNQTGRAYNYGWAGWGVGYSGTPCIVLYPDGEWIGYRDIADVRLD